MRRLLVLLRNLPPDSALARAMSGRTPEWEIAYAQLDAIAQATVAIAVVAAANGVKGRQIRAALARYQPIRRPWDPEPVAAKPGSLREWAQFLNRMN